MNYSEAIEYLDSLNTFGIKPGLKRIKLLLNKLGNPEQETPCVHVTGTNGKGSVVSMLTSVLEKSNLSVGSFTSPHLVSPNERFIIRGKEVSDEDFAWALTRVEKAAMIVTNELEQPTQFEILTAVAFILFKKAKLDIVVLEVGMGGLLDSTNVITPLCSIITNVSVDHIDKLGKTIEEIAFQKAGIIKNNVPIITAVDNTALPIIQKQAKSLNSPLYIYNKDFVSKSLSGSIEHEEFLFEKGTCSSEFTIHLGGKHQVINASIVAMAALLLSDTFKSITNESIKEGFLAAKWAGRLELVSRKPDIIFDGAHNLAGAEALRNTLDNYYGNKNICFIMGMMQDKDIKGVVEKIVRTNDTLIAVRADDTNRAANPESIAAFSKGKNYVISDVMSGIIKAKDITDDKGVICICGSLYLLGHVKSFWDTVN